MKRNLGSLIVIILLVPTLLIALPYKWEVMSSKKRAYTNEAIFIEYKCTFENSSEVYVIDFHPQKKTKDYEVVLVRETEKIQDKHRVNSFEYLLFVKKGGRFVFAPDVTMKETNEDSIKNSVLGRDNANYEEYRLTKQKQRALIFDIVPLANDLVGDFRLKVDHLQEGVKAFEPYHLDVTISGKGNFEALQKIEMKIDDVKVFTQPPKKNVKLTKDGYEGVWKQTFSFVAQKDFTIPKIKIAYFDLQSQTEKFLEYNATDVKVTQGYEIATLIDEEKQDFTFSWEYGYYFLTFCLGFLVAKVKLPKRVHKKSPKDVIFSQKLQNAKSIDEIAVLLVLQDSNYYKEIIRKIDKNSYKKLSDIKKELMRY